MVYLQTRRVFHSLMVLSLNPETIWRLSWGKATLSKSLECPIKRLVIFPMPRSQRRSILSQEQERTTDHQMTSQCLKQNGCGHSRLCWGLRSCSLPWSASTWWQTCFLIMTKQLRKHRCCGNLGNPSTVTLKANPSLLLFQSSPWFDVCISHWWQT